MIVVHYPSGADREFGDMGYEDLDEIISEKGFEVVDTWVKNDVSHFVVDFAKPEEEKVAPS